ncbi:MAG: FtsX-like permease family protein [Verrucomicrobiota bacterium]|nr:FtsX-like permease family protein [Verrucomicrobiota bacterium]
MKFPWFFYLAWKQLFPSRRKISFFSLLAILGVALGVNVMIVVIAFMQGFQQKFRNDIIDSQGHARVIPVGPDAEWREIQSKITERRDVVGVTPYLQGQLLLQNRSYHAIPFAMGMDPHECNTVLPMNQFLENGQMQVQGFEAMDITPVPTVSYLEDEVVFVTRQVANRLGVRPSTILELQDENSSLRRAGNGRVLVTRLDPFVPNGQWSITFLDESRYQLKESMSGFSCECEIGLEEDLGIGYPIFVVERGDKPFAVGDSFRFQTFRSSIIEVYSPHMIEMAKSDELSPPREVRLGGIFEVPWQGYHSEALVGTMRFMQDLRSEEGVCDGFYLRFSDKIASSENRLKEFCNELEIFLDRDWLPIPWFVENAWFFELLKFEEYLMILIMIPIGLVAAFAIAIALMTSVLRKIREIGLLVAMGAKRWSVGGIFCMQGFIIGFLGSILGCGFALLFIRFRDSLMNLIVTRIAGESGKVEVVQFYDFYALDVPYPWQSEQSLMTFLTFALFAILVSTIAGLLPAWRASRMNPAEALRSE